MINKIITLCVVFFTILIFKNNNIVYSSIQESMTLFLNSIFPSLFPMFIISSLLIKINFVKYVNLVFNKINQKLFNINSNLSYILLMSIISGFPSNAKMAREMYEQGIINELDIQKIILFTHFANPLFIINMVDNKKILILVAHYIGNFFIAFILRKKYVSTVKNIEYENNNKNSLPDIFFSCINDAISTLMFILGTVTTFYIIAELLNIPIFSILLELTHGLSYLTKIDVELKLKTMLIGGILSFGGICIHFQVYGLLSDIKIKYKPYLLSRLIHALITMSIIFLFYNL